MKKIIYNKNILALAYKLLHDVLLLILGSFALLLVAEGLLPGFISAHISIAKVAVVLIATIGAIAWLGKKLGITYPTPAISKNKLLPMLLLFAFLLVGNSVLKFSMWQNLVITLTTLTIFFFFYKLIFSDKE